jgi:hypothetical protein
MNDNLKKNAEHYADPTPACSLAIPEPGDLYALGDVMALILKNHGPFSTVLILTERDHPRNVKLLTSAGTRWTDPRLTTYRWHDKLGEYVETLPTKTFDIVAAAMEKALGIESRHVPEADLTGIERMKKQIEDYHKELTRLRCELAELKKGGRYI